MTINYMKYKLAVFINSIADWIYPGFDNPYEVASPKDIMDTVTKMKHYENFLQTESDKVRIARQIIERHRETVKLADQNKEKDPTEVIDDIRDMKERQALMQNQLAATMADLEIPGFVKDGDTFKPDIGQTADAE